MNIVMVGPVYPYKGGIAHYTGLLCRTLRKDHHVRMVSFSMQYPKILFKKPQKDESSDAFRVEDVEYSINTVNPLSWRKVAKSILAEDVDLVILQWWHPYFSICYSGLLRKIKAKKVILLCHNVLPHERFLADRFLTKRVFKKSNGYIVHSELDAQDLKTLIPAAVYKKNFHPTYDHFRQEGISKEKARSLLNIANDERVLLFFGVVREYKGLVYLLQAMPEIVRKIGPVRLVVAGDFGSSKDSYLEMIQKLDISSYIDIKDGYIPDHEVEKFFSASDLVVLPYISATQSGVVQTAFGMGRAVLVTKVGGLPEVVSDQKTGYVVPPQDVSAICDAVVDYFVHKRAEDFEKNIAEQAYLFSWDRMKETIEDLADEIRRDSMK